MHHRRVSYKSWKGQDEHANGCNIKLSCGVLEHFSARTFGLEQGNVVPPSSMSIIAVSQEERDSNSSNISSDESSSRTARKMAKMIKMER